MSFSSCVIARYFTNFSYASLIRILAIIFYYGVSANELGGILCRLPKNVGYSCGVTSQHAVFYFDADIGECIEFMFQGCGGNQNRFSTRQDCLDGCKSLTLCGKGMPLMDFAGNIKRCDGERVPCPGSHVCIGKGMDSVCCQKADRICQTSVNPGSPCGVVAMTRYYFDFSSKTCRPFAFTGCGGNENNFKTKGECMQFCSNEILCPRGDPLPDRYSINNIASCMENKHCPGNYTCTSRHGKKGACCPSRDFVCGTPFEVRSSCRRPKSEASWSFNYQKGECERIEHPACDEHWNAFPNHEQCVEYCVGTCPDFKEIHINPLTGQPQLCDTKKKTGCPLGYECFKSSPFASICCKTSPVCPSAESIALIESEDLVRCNPAHADSCPEHYSCQEAKNLEYICCTKPLSCPAGMSALREDGGKPRVCSVGVEGTCPQDHICVLADGQAIFGSARHMCCKPEKKCIVPYVDPNSKRPQRCFPGDTKCPSQTACMPALEDSANLTNAFDYMFFCCHTVDVFTCPDGDMPKIDTLTNKPMRCRQSNPFSCPAELVCSKLIDGQTACCPNAASKQLCTEALLGEDEQPVKCTGWDDNSCPLGKCRRAADNVYYCCRDLTKEPTNKLLLQQQSPALLPFHTAPPPTQVWTKKLRISISTSTLARSDFLTTQTSTLPPSSTSIVYPYLRSVSHFLASVLARANITSLANPFRQPFRSQGLRSRPDYLKGVKRITLIRPPKQ